MHQVILLIIVFFFFSETKIVFKSNLVLIEYFFPKLVYFFTFRYSVYLGVHPVPLSFFIRTNKLLMRLIVTHCSYYVSVFHKTFAIVNGKKFLLILINLIFAWFERTIVGDSLHIWRNFWWLIITSTKLM